MALQALCQRAGPAVAALSVEETQQTDWSAELRGVAFDLALAAFTPGNHDAVGSDSPRRFTELAARDEAGRPLAAMRWEGWHALAILPALATWTHATARRAVWRHRGEPRAIFDGRYPLQHPPVTRGAEAILAELAAEGWSISRDPAGLSLVRARRGRDLVMTAVLVALCALLLPLLAIVAAVLVARRLATGRWDYDPATVQPWRDAEDRLELRLEPGVFALRGVLDGRERLAHRWTRETLGALFAAADSDGLALGVVEPDQVQTIPLSLRGEIRGRSPLRRTPALLAELVACGWTPPA